MRLTDILGSLFSAVLASAAGTCNRDNCYRAVLGTNGGQSSSRVQDCSRYFSCAATSAATTTTVTQTVSPSGVTVTVTAPQQTSVVTTAVTASGATVTSLVTNPPPTLPVTVTAPGVTVTTTVFPSYMRRRDIERRQATTVTSAASVSATCVCTPSSPTVASILTITITETLPPIVTSTVTVVQTLPPIVTSTVTIVQTLPPAVPTTVTVTVTQIPLPVTTPTTVAITTSITTPINTPVTSMMTTRATASGTCPTAIPTYANACSGASRYSSACACAGMTPITVAPSTSTTTTTTTLTPTTSTVTTIPAPTTLTSTTTVAGVTTTVISSVVLPTVTTTITVPGGTTTVTTSPTVPTLCNNAGLQWAYYRDYQTAASPSFNPAVVKSETPSATGTTTYLELNNVDTNETGVDPIYGRSLPGTNYILQHRGYLYAPETGTYRFVSTNVDDVVEFWIGPLAYSGWSGSNAEQDTVFRTGPAQNTTTQSLVGGRYYPVRLVFKQGPPSHASFGFRITSPSGLTLISDNPNQASPSPFIVQYSCDRVLAPPFPAYGSET